MVKPSRGNRKSKSPTIGGGWSCPSGPTVASGRYRRTAVTSPQNGCYSSSSYFGGRTKVTWIAAAPLSSPVTL